MRGELRRLRYKPGTSVVLGFDLITAARLDDVAVTEPCGLGVRRPRRGEDREDPGADPGGGVPRPRPRRPRPRRDGGGRPGAAAAAWAGHADATARFLDRVLPDAPDPGRARIRTVRHNPGRRWVGVLERDAEPDLLLRAYSSTARMVRAAGCYKALGRTEVPTPRPVGKSRSFAALAVTWTEGDTLGLAAGEYRWRAAGTTRPTCTTAPTSTSADPRPGHDAAAVERAAEQIAHLLPALADEVRSIAGTTVRLLEDVPGDVVPLHGDFSADQVVVGPDGVPVLIDLDSAHPVRRPPTWVAWWRRPSPRPRRWARRRRASATSRPCWRGISRYADRRNGSRWTCTRSRSGFARRPTRSGPARRTGRSR